MIVPRPVRENHVSRVGRAVFLLQAVPPPSWMLLRS